MKKLTNEEYDKMVKKASPNSKSYIKVPTAFCVGGLICMLGQAFLNMYSAIGMSLDIAATATSVTLIFFSALFTGLKVYDNIAVYAGAGTLVPITGFANAIASPAMEFKSEGLIMGLGAKMFVIAGPVIVYGITASVVYGVVLYALGLA